MPGALATSVTELQRQQVDLRATVKRHKLAIKEHRLALATAAAQLARVTADLHTLSGAGVIHGRPQADSHSPS